MGKRRVVITGLGVVSPLGNDLPSTWEAAKSGQSGIGPLTRFDCAEYPARIAGEVRNFDPAKYLEAKELKKHDLFSQFSVAAAQQAWDDANLNNHKYTPARMGCILGIGIGGLPTFEKFHTIVLESGPKKISPFLIPAMISNLGPGNVAIRFGLKGVNFAINSACTSGTHALGESARMISDGVQDLVLAGGSESALTKLGVGGFCAMKALSTRNDDPTRASRPFDKDRDGFVMGEGSAVLVLEEFEAAKARGAKIYAEVLGYGASCDAYHITSPCVDGEGAVNCMRLALEHAGLRPEEVSYINAHGTSTDANDKTETVAIKHLFGGYAKNGLMVSSTKSMTGHLLGAAGALEALFSTMAVAEGVVPPTINLDNPDPDCDLDYVPHNARKAEVKVAMSNSFGFGGTNASIIVGRVR